MNDAPSIETEVAMQHALFTIALIGFLWGLWKGYKKWRESRVQAAVARQLQSARLEAVHKELHPNGGASMADRVSRIEAITTYNQQMLEGMEAVHKDIQTRIDGLFELLLGPGANTVRRMSLQHHRLREESPDAIE